FHKMLFQVGNVLFAGVPESGIAFSAGEESVALHIFARPIDTWILHGARQEVIDNGIEALFSAEPIEEREFSLSLGGAIALGSGAGGSCGVTCLRHGFFDVLLARALTGIAHLLRFGHSLAGALVSVAAAGCEEVL